MTEQTYRIGEAADRLGVTPRTIRYYQELGLVHADGTHVKGTHRVFTEADLSRLADLIRLRDLLGLSLDELTMLAEAEEARAHLRGQWAETHDDADRRRIITDAIPHIRRQLELVESRRQTFDEVGRELTARVDELESMLAELSKPRAARRQRRAPSR